ncbi:MAG: excinuclease ABC subunit UvrA [Patescibacteria group bacterium]|nr:excinuclease ABC subunit UvrA [Patescibacteria group bacterium]MDD5490991.1 excinuclease ABC subunit UvrA [Patescibacteria group bacterium]
MPQEKIIIKGARVHNLKNINVNIPKNKLVVITGLSGSGKSSLAFDTIYAEGQRRYVESLSSYARQFLGVMDKPDVDKIEGLSPAIAIDQRSSSTNPRSTVGTMTEIYDYLRLLYARAGRPHCPKCGKLVAKQTANQIVQKILTLPSNQDILVLSPVIRDVKGDQHGTIKEIKKANYKNIRIDGEFLSVEEAENLHFDKNSKHTIEVVVGGFNTTDIDWEKLPKVIDAALDLGNGFISVYLPDNKENITMSEFFVCPECDIYLPEIEPRLFSFNSPNGACASCSGLGTTLEVIPDLVIPNKKLTLNEGAIKPWTRISGNQSSQNKLLKEVAKKHGFTLSKPIEKLKKSEVDVILHGTGEEIYNVDGEEMKFEGVVNYLAQKYRETDSDYIRKEIENYMQIKICKTCDGKRLRPEALAVTVGGYSINDLVRFDIGKLISFFKELTGVSKKSEFNIKKEETLSVSEKKISDLLIREALVRLQHLANVGLVYLNLDRPTTTLSGGEAQRIRLATQIGSDLSGVIYILDEPSIGLHQRDNDKLIETLRELQKIGNTVIVVEHDKSMMEAADEIIDIGPGAGEYGGHIVAQGSPAEIKKDKSSLTGKYLSGKSKIELPKEYRRGSNKFLIIEGASEFNLKNITAKIPLGKLVCLTGVSGSGKSTLMTEILAKALAKKFYRAKDEPGKHKAIKGMENIDKVITIDQSPIGRTPRSNPATYTGVFTYIRDLFTLTPEAKMRGYDAGKFSFNVRGGRCESCGGDGFVRIEMQFLPDVYVECEICHGKRYTAEALEIHYKGKNIAGVLEMTVEEARKFFSDIEIIKDKLNILCEVGLGYIKLGQPAPTLSGGEAQRVKLATELSRRATGKTLYILDEPTTGLHFEDIKKLLIVLNQLVDKGNTVLIIEHNLDVVKCADWVIDMGPEGGDAGGYIVAEGTPKDVVKVKKSFTGEYLKKFLK